MLRKILKWTGLVLLVLITAITITTMARQHFKYEAPYPNIKASTDSAVIAKGRHIVLGPGHCVDCHSPVHNVDSLLKLGQEVPLIGGNKFDLPFGKFYTRKAAFTKNPLNIAKHTYPFQDRCHHLRNVLTRGLSIDKQKFKVAPKWFAGQCA